MLRGPRQLCCEWTPEMPVPAGIGIDRRRFLVGAAGGLLSVYGADRLGLTNTILGEGIAQSATTQHPIFVSVFLQGGIDALSAIDRPDDFSLWLDGVWGDVFTWPLDSASALGEKQRTSADAAVAQVAEAASEVGIVRKAPAPFRDSNGNSTYHSPVTYPTSADSDFPQRLAGLAAMIAHGLPLRCDALTSDTQFDTHSAQPQTFNSGLKLIADSIAAFQADLEARGIADRLMMHEWSEFGRRAQENGSDGTNHGAAGISLLVGSRLKGKMVGGWPDLKHLDINGNQRENVDFRGVYCSLLEQWFGIDAASVIPDARRFARHRLIA